MSNTLVIITADHGTHDVAFDGKSTADFEPEFKNVLNLGKKILPKSSHETGAKMIINLRNKIRDTKLKKVNEGLTPYQIRSRLPHTTLSIYDESIRTPLLFVGKGITQNKIIPNQVSALDIFPTIMELIHSTPISSQMKIKLYFYIQFLTNRLPVMTKLVYVQKNSNISVLLMNLKICIFMI